MTRSLFASLLGLGALLIVTTSANGVTVFTAELTTGQETADVVPTTSTGDPRPIPFGSATLTLNEDRTALTTLINIHNIDVTGSQTPDPNDDLRAAHIHAPAAPGSNAGVVWGFFGTPFNDNNPNDLVVTPFADGVGGTFAGIWNVPEGNNTTLSAQLPNILSGLSYLNFHTLQHPGGEIRGQITAVPDTGGTLALALGGMLGLFGLNRRYGRRLAIG